MGCQALDCGLRSKEGCGCTGTTTTTLRPLLHQKVMLARSSSWPAPAATELVVPNVALELFVFPSSHAGWLGRLKASAWMFMWMCSKMGTSLVTDMFSVFHFGP